MSQEPSSSALPTYDQLLRELKALRRPGLADLRTTRRPALSAAAEVAGFCEGPDAIPAGIEALLTEAVRHLGEADPLGRAAARTFGLTQGLRGAPAVERRKAAAAVYGITAERFRRQQEPQVIEQLAEAVLAVARRPFPGSGAGSGSRRGSVGPEPPLHIDGVPVGGRGAITLHVSPIELLRDIDILVSPENVYLEPSKTFHPTISGTLRLAAAERDLATGEIHDDVVARQLAGWLREHGRPGLPVRPGTVVPTSSGRLVDRGVRRIYHAAVATPQGWDYQVQPETLARAVAECFALARTERPRHDPGLSSLCFPLLGAGRGGLSNATSATWLTWAIRDELAHDDSWQVHMVVRNREIAEDIGAL
jgi:O-acetyl-ADP-ribose deacetylase (regulator of RNase III)